jgi:3-deoxy-7-phosphoheptulonate synthase
VAGLDYARRLKALQAEVSDVMLLVMRVYFEKPRTTTGWKGYINDPYLDDSFRVDEGMESASLFTRRLRARFAYRHRSARPDFTAIPAI